MRRFETTKYTLKTDDGRYVSGVTDCNEDGIAVVFDTNPYKAALWSAEDINYAQHRVLDSLCGTGTFVYIEVYDNA